MPSTSTSDALCSIKAKSRYGEFSHVLCITGIPFKLRQQESDSRSDNDDASSKTNIIPKYFTIDLPRCGIACTYDLDSPFLWTISQDIDDGLRTIDIDSLIRNTILLHIQHTDFVPLDISCLVLSRDESHERGVYRRAGVVNMSNLYQEHLMHKLKQAELAEVLRSSTQELETAEYIYEHEDETFDIELI